MKELILLAVLLMCVNAQVAVDDSKSINVEGCGRRPFANIKRDNLTVNKIVGGRPSIVGDWGWQIGMIRYGKFVCGGSLINSQWVITAAHCVRGSAASANTLLIGAHNRKRIEPWAIESGVSKIISHPKYVSSTKKNDIALIKLKTRVQYSDYIIPVCIDDGSIDYTDNSAWTSGWGNMAIGGPQTTVLNDVQTTVLSTDRCIVKYPSVTAETEVCAGDNDGKDTCQGDSGGPLVVLNQTDNLWYLHGVTSWGNDCFNGGLYARTSGFYSWIQKIIDIY